MPSSVIAVTNGEFTFDLEALTAVVRAQWPDAPFVPATGRRATVNVGQFQIPTATSFPEQVLVEVDVEGQALAIESPVGDLAAEVIAVATNVPGFPTDGSVVLAEWSAEILPLRPGMTKSDVQALPR